MWPRRLASRRRPPGKAGDVRVLVVDASDRGGIARYTDHLVAGLRSAGENVELCAPDGRARPALRLLGVSWRTRPRSTGGRLAFYSRRLIDVPLAAASLLTAQRRFRPTVVHLHTAVTRRADGALIRLLRRRSPVVLTIHNVVPHEHADREGRLERSRWRACDRLVVHSPELVGEVQAAAPRVPAAHVEMDLLPGTSGVDRTTARRQLGIDAAPVCLMLGLVRPYKGFGLMAEAWPAVQEAIPESVLIVAGSLLDPFRELERLCDQKGVVTRLGWQTDRETELWATAADLCLLPYSHGAHSGVLHRAVANGTPCLVSPCLSEEATRFNAGRIVPMEPGAWASAIVDALKQPLPPPQIPGGHPSLAHQMVPVYQEAIGSWRADHHSRRRGR